MGDVGPHRTHERREERAMYQSPSAEEPPGLGRRWWVVGTGALVLMFGLSLLLDEGVTACAHGLHLAQWLGLVMLGIGAVRIVVGLWTEDLASGWGQVSTALGWGTSVVVLGLLGAPLTAVVGTVRQILAICLG
ncbi:MAG TPA: hypothetical protein VGE07_27720 [Herpetosiphonaceae bacterium]